MLKKAKRFVAIAMIACCMSTLFQSVEAGAVRKTAINTGKAEYLGFGRLYPFRASDGTGSLYCFTTSAKNSYYQIKALVSAGQAFGILLYDESGYPVTEQIMLENQEYRRFVLEPEKQYFLQISGSADAAGEVLVSEIADDYADEWSEAQEILLKKEFLVTTECQGDSDYVKVVTSDSDVTYTLHMEPVSGGTGTYEVLDESGQSIENASGITDPEEKLVAGLLLEPQKTYYLKFSSKEMYCQMLVSIQETVNTYKLTYHLDGGKNHKENPGTYVATDTVALKSPSKKGYLFEGWFADAEYKEAIESVKGSGKRDYDLYAKWKKPEPATVTVTSYVSKTAGKAVLKFQEVSEAEGYQIRITRISKKKKYVSYETVKRTTVHFSNWKQGQKYNVNVRAYVIDSCGNRIYGAYSKTEGITVKKKAAKKAKK